MQQITLVGGVLPPLQESWDETIPGFVAGSCMLLVGIVWFGLAAWRWYIKDGRTAPEQRTRYVRLPLLLVGMTGSLTLLVLSPWRPWTHLAIGAVWAVTFPVRLTVSYCVVRGKFDPSLLRYRVIWVLTPWLLLVHPLLWPLSVPLLFVLGNEFGYVYAPRKEDE